MRDKQINSTTGGFLDAGGAAVSWACAAHCAAVPLAAGLLPAAGLGFLAHEGAELAFAALSTAIACATLVPGYRRVHRRALPLALFAAGLGALFAADPLFEDNFAGRLAVVAAGAALITAAHAANRRFGRRAAAAAGFRS